MDTRPSDDAFVSDVRSGPDTTPGDDVGGADTDTGPGDAAGADTGPGDAGADDTGPGDADAADDDAPVAADASLDATAPIDAGVDGGVSSVLGEEATLLAPDGALSDYFGGAVALSADGTRALVGAYADDGFTGTARVFLRSGTIWTEEATLFATGGAPDDWFGYSVALSADGTLALVGAPSDDTAGGASAGSARVFLRTGTTWTQEATLLAAAGAIADEFGHSVALSSDGSRAIVGAHQDNTAGGADAGSARVFLRIGTTWSEESMLVAADGAANDHLGFSVALSADGIRALVGAHQDDTAAGMDAGSAHIFVRTGASWTEEATLLASGGMAVDIFGYSVALSADGSLGLVGAIADDVAGANAGAARVFRRTGTSWTEEATLRPGGGTPTINFGISVALSAAGSRALVGALWGGGAGTGSARVFQRTGTTWSETAPLVTAAGTSSDRFGCSVALSAAGTLALVGADQDDTTGGADAGSVTVFTLPP